MATKSTKMIKVTSRGYVMTSRGRVLAPIRTPYRESISKIWSMITVDRADVWEKLPNGEFVKLTPLNFDKDNCKKEKPVEVKESVNNNPDCDNSHKCELTDEATFIEQTSEETEVNDLVEEKIEELATTSKPNTITNHNKNGYNKFDKRNKHSKPNQNNKTNASDIAVTPEEA